MGNCFSRAGGRNSKVVPEPQDGKCQKEAWGRDLESPSTHCGASADSANNGKFEPIRSKTSSHLQKQAESAQSLLLPNEVPRTPEDLRRASTPSEKTNCKKTTPLNHSSSKLEGIQSGTEKTKNATCTELDQGLYTRSNEELNKLQEEKSVSKVGSKTSLHRGTPTHEPSLVQHVQEGLRRISTPSTKSNSRKATPSSQSSNKPEGIQGGTETRKSTTPTEVNLKYEGLDTKSNEESNKSLKEEPVSKIGREPGLNKGIGITSDTVSVIKEKSDELLHEISATEIAGRNSSSEHEDESSAHKISSDDEKSITQSDTLMPENHGSCSILNKFKPKASEKVIREKVANLLTSWDASGKLAELESSAISVSIASTISIPILAAALKGDSTPVYVSMESQIAIAYKIYCWVSKNISYIDGKKSTDASDVLETKKAVCHGYTILFQALAKEAGLKVTRVSGNTRKWLSHPETHFEPNNNNRHTWNLVRHFYYGSNIYINNIKLLKAVCFWNSNYIILNEY